MKKLQICIFFLFLFFCSSCTGSRKHLINKDLELWKGTKGWTLAKAVRDEDSVRMRKILSKGEVSIDFREPKFGQNLLNWAVINNKRNAVRLLLEMGANPNLHDKFNGVSPIVNAASIGVDDIEILKLLLKHGGNPNDKVAENENFSEAPSAETPLTEAAVYSMEKIKLLIDAGADVNIAVRDRTFGTRSTLINTPLYSAANMGRYQIVSYLLFEKSADFKKTFVVTIDGDTISFAGLLRYWDFPLNSKEYKEKMKIVNYLKENGQDYWKTPIPKDIEKHNSKEYLEKY